MYTWCGEWTLEIASCTCEYRLYICLTVCAYNCLWILVCVCLPVFIARCCIHQWYAGVEDHSAILSPLSLLHYTVVDTCIPVQYAYIPICITHSCFNFMILSPTNALKYTDYMYVVYLYINAFRGKITHQPMMHSRFVMSIKVRLKVRMLIR